MVSELPGRNASEPIWPRKYCNPKAQPSLFGRRQHGASQGLMRRNTSAGGQEQHGDKVIVSNGRIPPRPVAKSAEQGSRITGDTGKSVDGERDSAGSVVARKRSNVRGAKRPCCL